MTLQRAEVRAHLSRILDEESQLLGELETLLRDESAILKSDDVEAIARIGSTRQHCIDALTRLDAERADSCRMLSFGQGRGAVSKLYSWCDPGGALESHWLANLAIARRCQQLNDTNGAVVTARLSRVQQLLMVIRGTSAPPVYSARGARHGVLGMRDLGRA
ncbi:MAG TPA: flagellar protein FlgN [Steroidobacteraceae bacterium]|jgi:flagellar biosynthesis/type III secretory pathway chaperone|nr:flagellar protein FlgN [Steroidobacteraceae bacterium]